MIVSNFTIAHYSRTESYRDMTSYHLQITNLDKQDVDFAIDCHFSSPPEDYVSRDYLAGGVSYSSTFRRLHNEAVLTYGLQIRGGATETFTLAKTAVDSRELQGHVELRIPSVRSGQFLRLAPQVSHHVSVVLHARRIDTRGTRITPIGEPSGNIPYNSFTGDNYSSESVALASGKAENEIVPDNFINWFQAGAVSQFARALHAGEINVHEIAGASLLPDQERVPALIDLLDSLAADEDIDALNAILRAHDTPLRLQKE